jgi:hypothetical protein
LEHESSSPITANERRNFFRIEDTVLMRYQPIDENSALANHIPSLFKEDPGYSLMQELMEIDRDNNKFLRAIGEKNYELEAYLKGLSKKLDLIAAKVVESDEKAAHQEPHYISISEGGLSFVSPIEYAHDSYIALQMTLLPSHHSLVLFTRVINCSVSDNGYSIALSFVQLKDTERQIITKHIMQLQMAQRRQQHHGK